MKKLIFIMVLILFPSVLFSQSWVELNNKGMTYFNNGDYKNALIYWEKGVIQAEKEFGKKHNNYSISLNNIAELYRVIGQYKNAELFHKEALDIKKEVLGEMHPDYALSLNNLALLYKTIGQYNKAESLYLEALKIDKEELGEKHPYYAKSLNNLGALYYLIGQYNKAELLYLEALKIRKEVLGEMHPDYAMSLNNLALLYKTIGQYNKAELFYIEASRIYKEVLGEKHPDYAQSLNNLAVLYLNLKQYNKSEMLLNEALIIRKEIYGEKHSEYAMTLNNLALLYLTIGKYEKAELLFKEVLKIRKDMLGEKHSDYAISLNNIAGLYYNLGQYEKAEPLYIKVNKIFREVLGEKHPYYANSLNNLGVLYYLTGQNDNAESLILEASKNCLNQIKTYFPSFSENEKVKFLMVNENNFNFVYSFGFKRIKENKSITNFLLDLRINTKGFILSSTSNVRKRILESNDIELIEKLEKLFLLRVIIGKAYTMTLDEQKKKEINLTELEESANETEKEISLKSEDFKSEMESRVIKYENIKNKLKENEVAIEFFDFNFYDKKWTDTIYYFALIVKPSLENPLLVKLCTLNQLKEYLSGSSDSKDSYVKNDEKNTGLNNLIWKPLEEHLKGIENVYLSPSGILNKVSFASLKIDEQNLLIDKYQLRYVGNLKDIVTKKESKIKSSELTASVFGGIKYELDSLEMIKNSLKYKSEEETSQYSPISLLLREEPERSGWGYLNGTLIEANKIKDILKKSGFVVKEYLNEDGCKEAFKLLSGKKSPNILHITTHGFFYPESEKKYQNFGIAESKDIYKLSDNPLFRSGLILAGANRVWKGGDEIEGVENGILTAYEVSNMDLQNTELVVLSACETGLGDIKGGEGVYGLQRAFKVAGAKTIIMSLWKVPDKETVELMELFYSNWLEKKMTKHEAFTRAQKEMRKKYPPYYWAAFVMVE